MISNKTLDALRKEIAGSERRKAHLLACVSDASAETEVVFDVCQVVFDRRARVATVEWFCDDPQYPEAKLTFDELSRLVRDPVVPSYVPRPGRPRR